MEFIEKCVEIAQLETELTFGFASFQHGGGGGGHLTLDIDQKSEKSDLAFEF
jgi:hypothetical protein